MAALIRQGASVNVQLKTGDTLLHIAFANKDMQGKQEESSWILHALMIMLHRGWEENMH
jgi:ankyrin repeat protein